MLSDERLDRLDKHIKRFCKNDPIKMELIDEVTRLRSELAEYKDVIPDLECLRRVADLADKGDEHGRYHYVSMWLRRLIAMNREVG